MIITSTAYARAGLIGNPSDGYFGKTIAFLVRNFRARVRLWESPHFEIIPGNGDLAKFASVREFLLDQRLHGYYGGMRLIKASLKRFDDYCEGKGIDLDTSRSFTIGYDSDIPRLVGLGGSSAIVVATLRALMQFYGVTIPLEALPGLAHSVEVDELKIAAGLQDRVIQSYEGVVAMDFDKSLIQARGYGNYERLRPAHLPPLYIAYDPQRAEVSDVPHRGLRELFARGDKTVLSAIQRYRELTDLAKAALLAGDWDALGRLMTKTSTSAARSWRSRRRTCG